MEITVGLALIAGLISFISPCVLPLVPAYIGYMGGRMTNTVASEIQTGQGQKFSTVKTRLNTFVHGVFFVGGFTLVFVSLGLLSTALIQQVGGTNIRLITDLIGRLGGVLIIFFGLHFMGILSGLIRWLRSREALFDQVVIPLLIGIWFTLLIVWGFTGSVAIWDAQLWDTAPLLPVMSLGLALGFWLWMISQRAFATPGAFIVRVLDKVEFALYSDTRRQMMPAKHGNYIDSVLMGIVFSAGWTPCIGPVYGTVLTLAANGGDVGQAGVLLGMYSLGLGIPFLLTALLLDGAQVWLRRLQRYMRAIELTSGAFLVVIGLAVATGQLQNLSQQFAGQFAEFSINLEEQVIGLVTSEEVPLTAEVPANSPAISDTSPNTDIEVGLNIGQRAPDFQTLNDQGETIILSGLRGNVILLNFWATWCGPCRIEMPEFQRQFERYAEQGFIVLAVNNGETLEDVIGFREELNLTFLMAMDERAVIQRQYGIMSYPSTFLIDRDGRIIARHFGPLTTQQMEQMLKNLNFSS